MADDGAKQPEEMRGAGISDATPPDPAPDTANKTPPADNKKPAAQTAPSQQSPAPQEQPAGDDVPHSAVDAFKKAMGIKTLDPHLEEMLRVAQFRLTADKAGMLIDMPQNNHTIHCGKMPDGIEFIGTSHKSMIVDEHDAVVMIGLAKGRGWKSVNVNGNQQEKELLWIEAQRQGLHVNPASFQPDPNSEIVKKWLQEQAAAPKQEPVADPKPAVTESAPATEDFHLKTMQLLQAKAASAQDKDVKAGLETILEKFKEGTAVHGTAEIFKQLETFLSDKQEARAGYNLAADFLNKTEPKLGLAKLADPVPAAAPAATAPAAGTKGPQMAPELL